MVMDLVVTIVENMNTWTFERQVHWAPTLATELHQRMKLRLFADACAVILSGPLKPHLL